MNVGASIVPYNNPDDRRSSWVEPLDIPGVHLSVYHDFDQRRASRAPLYFRECSDIQISRRERPTTTTPELSEQTRIRINVRGKKYETFKSTLDRYPDTLLGSDGGRDRFYDDINKELCFNRDPNSFDAILFFYQSGGILARPSSVEEELFDDEVKFFHLFNESSVEVNESLGSIPDELLSFFPRGDSKKEVLWNILERPPESRFGRLFARISWVIILLSVIAFCLETVQPLKNLSVVTTKFFPHKNYSRVGINGTSNPRTTTSRDVVTNAVSFWFFVDTIFVIFFTLEYSARVYSAPNRLKFIRSFLSIVDFCAIAPYYILHIANEGQFNSIKSFNVIRSIRLFRVIRLLKLSRYSSGLKLLGRALSRSRGKMMSLCCCIAMAVVFFSGLLYYIEGYHDENVFSSIPNAFWFCIITMSTVGYGDVVPRTPPGKLVGSCCALTGIILLYILPIPSFVTEFSELYNKWRRAKGRTKAEKSGAKKPSRMDLSLW